MYDKNNSDENNSGIFRKMLRFISENSGTVVKILIHQLGLTVFGFLLYSASASADNSPVVLGLGVFSAVFYLVLLYVLSWDNGASDKIKIDGGRMKSDAFKGAKTALVANFPNLLLAILSLVGYLFIDKTALDATGSYISPKWAINLHGIAQIIGVFLNSMYTGIADVTGIISKPYYLFIVCVPSVLACALGYFFGTKEKLGIFTSAPKK